MHAAALAVYADLGWSGFTVEAVARTAGVGQAAVYRRWASKEALLADALGSSTPVVPDIDTGSSRQDLLAVCRHLLESFRQPLGVAGLRIVLDARTNAELAAHLRPVMEGGRWRAVREVVTRADSRGDLRTTTDLALQMLTGTALSRVLFDVRAVPPAGQRGSDTAFLEALVGMVLRPSSPARASRSPELRRSTYP